MGRVVEGHDSRDPIHDALIGLCAERNVGEVTVEDLCERAGVEVAAFQSRYEDLEDCFVEALDAELERFRSRLDPIRKGDAPWRDRVRGTGYELLELFREDERATRFLVLGARSGGERALLLFWAEVEAMVDLMDEGRQCLEDPDSLTRSTAEQIAGGYFNQLYGVVVRGPLPEAQEIIPQLMYSAVLPYLGEEAAAEELTMPAPARRAV